MPLVRTSVYSAGDKIARFIFTKFTKNKWNCKLKSLNSDWGLMLQVVCIGPFQSLFLTQEWFEKSNKYNLLRKKLINWANI